MATHDRKTSQVPITLLLAAATLLAAASGVAGLARQAAELGPQVGDLVAFDPAHPSVFTSTARLTAERPGQTGCVLDVSVLQHSGGSLVVEQRGAGSDRLYRLHWAGPRTSNDAANCGGDADVIVSATDMNALGAAASGFGGDGISALRLR